MPIKYTHTPKDALHQLEKAIHPVHSADNLDRLIEEIGNARFVLLGEASHGTHEYYTWRTKISQRLIAEKNFSFIAVEGDWPDCYRLNRYVKGYNDSGERAIDVLQAFNRWPTWMWANWETVALAEWLRKYNSDLPANRRVGFYGLDVYSLWESMEAIARYLEKNDPKSLKWVKKAMSCFEPYNVQEGFSYAESEYGMSASCAQQVEDLLAGIRYKMSTYNHDPEAVFSTEQNALVAVNAERYYQVMLHGGEASWNIRDRHMCETLNRLMDFHGKTSKVIVWEHNTHIGDARATNMKHADLINVGQVVKDEHEKEGVVRVGFGSYEGSVIAGKEWDAKMEIMKVPPAKEGSWEHLLHECHPAGNKLVFSKDIKNFISPIGHRAIGVVYDPDYEFTNYVPSVIPSRYEAFVFIDKTQALHPLHVKTDELQAPETYPWGV